MKLLFSFVVLVFVLNNPNEAKVPEIPSNLANLTTYLENRENLLTTVSNSLATSKLTLTQLLTHHQNHQVMLQQMFTSLDITYKQLTSAYTLASLCALYHNGGK
ncbi:uncharacterized protein LOC144631009 [Oculina patagonica]